MRQRRPFLTFALALLLCLSLAACGAKQYPMQITVVNRSTYPIADIRISLTTEEGWGKTAWRPHWRRARVPRSTWGIHGRAAERGLQPSVLR